MPYTFGQLGGFGEGPFGGESVEPSTFLDAIHTGRVGDGQSGEIDGRENGMVADTVAGTVREEE